MLSSRAPVLERLSSSRRIRSHSILQVPKKYSSHSPLMMALEKVKEGQDGDSVVETLLELGASVAFKNKVGVVMERLLWHLYIMYGLVQRAPHYDMY